MKYGCIDVLLRQGVQRGDIVELEVPGAFELPFAAKSVITKASPSTGNIDAVVALGCLIKGETMHLSPTQQHNTPSRIEHAHWHYIGARTHPLQPSLSLCVVTSVSTSVPLCQPG